MFINSCRGLFYNLYFIIKIKMKFASVLLFVSVNAQDDEAIISTGGAAITGGNLAEGEDCTM